MDEFKPQSPGIQVTVGHEEGDFSARGIVIFIGVLVFSGVMTFVIAHYMMIGLESLEKKWYDPKLSAAEQQLEQQREVVTPREGKGPKKPPNDWWERQADDKAVQRIFARPVLQYDDTTDMDDFRNSVQEKLKHTGKNPDGTIHIPIDRAIEKLANEGLPAVNGTFNSGPPLAAPTYIAEEAARMAGQTTDNAVPPPGPSRSTPGVRKKK